MKIIILVVILLFVNTKGEFQLENDYEIDPKEAFFRNLRSYDAQEELDIDKTNRFSNIPKPGGFQIEKTKVGSFDKVKRSYHILPSPGLTSHFKINLPDENQKHKRSKRAVSSEEVADIIELESDEQSKNNDTEIEEINNGDLVINDFIRFKRNSDISKSETDPQTSRLKREPEMRTEKMIMEHDFDESGTDREPRGATKEQWIKQPYPVEHPVDDNVPSASDNIRAPRVHFVTQRRTGSNQNQGVIPDLRPSQTQQSIPPSLPPPPPAFGHRMRDDREREGRARDFDPYPRSQNFYPIPRPRSYDPYRPRYYDPYFERFDDRRYGFDGFDSRYKFEDGRPMLPPPPPQITNKQRRIIYYATLPEVVRNPSSDGDRYGYRQDRYEDRYLSDLPSPVSGTGGAPAGHNDYYRSRKLYDNNQLQKQRDYESTTNRKKTPLYPVKVSTDVNVREPKKNPERRIYSEVDRRYGYKSPPSFETAEDGNF